MENMTPQFNEEEASLLLSALAFAISADVCWDITPETEQKIKDLIGRMKPYQIKVSPQLYCLPDKDMRETEYTETLIDDCGLRVKN